MSFQHCALLLVDLPSGALLRQVTFRSLINAALIVFAAIFLIRYVATITEALSQRSPGARFILKWIEQTLRLVVSFVAILSVLLVLAPNADTFLAAIGSAAIAIALGAQDFVKNIVGGFVILTDKPYQLGDRVRIGDTVGEVVHIGLRSTKLRTPQDSRVTVSNSDLLSGQVENENHGVPECMVVTTLYLPADADPHEALKLAYDAAWCCPYLRAQNPVLVLLSDEYTESPFMQLKVKAYVFDHRYVGRMQTDITTRIKKELDRVGILSKWGKA